jgi:hypothetical protein
VAPGWQNCIFRCADACPVTPEIFPESLDFPETPEKSLEYPDFADKIVFSGDFSGLAYSPPLGDIKILSKPLPPTRPTGTQTDPCGEGRGSHRHLHQALTGFRRRPRVATRWRMEAGRRAVALGFSRLALPEARRLFPRVGLGSTLMK